MTNIEDCRQLYLTEKEIDLLKTLVLPGTDFDDDGSIKSDCTDEAHVASTLYEKLRKQRRGDAGALWVSIYERGDMYGGPEEGGWWYSHYTLVNSRGFTDAESTVAEFNKMCADFAGDDATLHPLTVTALTPKLARSDDAGYLVTAQSFNAGTTADGQTIIVMIETQLGSQMTVDRPFYC